MKSDKLRINLGNSRYTLIPCSVMGEGKIENQDSFEIYHDENQIIIVVADGLGSAIYSKEGSSKIVSIAIRLLSERHDLSNIAFDIQAEWKKGLEGNLNFYDTTVKFIKITETEVLFGGVGDGWIALKTSDNFVDMVSSNSFSNQTDTILSFDLKTKFRTQTIESNSFKSALISTDGFSEDIDKENGEAFLIAVSDQIASDAEAFKCEIEETLTHWPVETNRDDKTVVFINREYNHE